MIIRHLIGFIAALMLCGAPVCEAATVSDIDNISRVTRDIFLKDIELERFNIAYRQHANVQGRWRGPRYFLSQETNNAATMAGLFDGVAIRYPSINNPWVQTLDNKGHLKIVQRSPSRVQLEHSFIPQMIGQFAGATGSAIELGINKYHDHQAKKLGLSHKQALVTAARYRSELEALFDKRCQLIADAQDRLSPHERRVLDAQGAVLHDLCDISLDEFAHFYLGARRFRAFQDSLYVLDIGKNLVGAAGNIVAMYSIDHRKAKLNGPAGICTFVSGTLIAANPYISRGTGWLVQKVATRRVQSFRQETDLLATLQKDEKTLQDLLHEGEAQSSDAQIISLLEADEHGALHESMLRRKIDMAERQRAAGTRSATENILAGTVIGATKMSLGICAMIAGYRFAQRPASSNEVLYAGSLAYGIGSAIGVADNVRIQMRNEIERRRNARDGVLPNQVLQRHLAELATLEARLKRVQ